MNKLNENLNFYSSYFHGVQDIIEFKSATQAGMGVVKILLGFTLVVPIIFAVGYYTSRSELRELESLCGRVSKALNSGDTIEKPTQNDLIKFISKQVLDGDGNHDFEAAFQRLDSTSQKMFFDSMADKGMLDDSLVHVSQDIRELNIGFGQNPSREMIDKTIIELCKFKQLHTITFDLSQTTHYTNGIEGLFKKSIRVIKLESEFASCGKQAFDLRDDRISGRGLSRPNNSLPASRLIDGVVYHLIKESALAKINFNFKLEPGLILPVFIANLSRMAQIPEDDANQAAKRNPLNNVRPSLNAKDRWFAQVGGHRF